MEFFKLPRKLRFSVHFACITDLGIQTCALWQAKLVSITNLLREVKEFFS